MRTRVDSLLSVFSCASGAFCILHNGSAWAAMEVYGLIEVGPHCKYPNGLKQADIIPPARIKFKRGLYYAQRLIEMYSAKIQVKLYEEE